MMEINKDNYFRLLAEMESLKSHPEDFDYWSGFYTEKGCIDCVCRRLMGIRENMSSNIRNTDFSGLNIHLYLNISPEDANGLYIPSYHQNKTSESLEAAIGKLKDIGKKYGIESFQPNETAFLTELKDSLELVGK